MDMGSNEKEREWQTILRPKLKLIDDNNSCALQWKYKLLEELQNLDQNFRLWEYFDVLIQAYDIENFDNPLYHYALSSEELPRALIDTERPNHNHSIE